MKAIGYVKVALLILTVEPAKKKLVAEMNTPLNTYNVDKVPEVKPIYIRKIVVEREPYSRVPKYT